MYLKISLKDIILVNRKAGNWFFLPTRLCLATPSCYVTCIHHRAW